eukprot:m.81998 g.81998  ORF g.81998 m.81998 type:complete len:59 (+) comp12847_c0_seq2:536-712(+)
MLSETSFRTFAHEAELFSKADICRMEGNQQRTKKRNVNVTTTSYLYNNRMRILNLHVN